MAYPDLADLLADSDVDALNESTPAEQATYRRLAISAVERYTGQKFEPFVGTINVPGSGGDTLFLPRRVEAITVVAMNGNPLDMTNFALSDDGDAIRWVPASTHYAVVAMRDPMEAADSRTFRSGPDNIAITGTFGWTDTPDNVKDAIRIDMEDQALAQSNDLAGTIAAYRRLGIKDVSQGNLRLSLGSLAGTALSPRAAALVDDLIWQGPSGYVV